MRIVFLGNNRLGWSVLRYLREAGEDDVVGLVVHPESRRKFGPEIIETAGLDDDCVFDGSQLQSQEVLDTIRALNPDIAVSVMFGYILRDPMIGLFPRGVVNLHPSYLPYNRGAYPNVWSIIDGTPAGTTLHYIDRGVDTGDIIAQRRVEVTATETGGSLYEKLEATSLALFQETWPMIQDGTAPRTTQKGTGTSHRTADVAEIDLIDLDRSYVARDLIDRLRARTCPPYNGTYFEVDGKRVYMRLDLTEADPE